MLNRKENKLARRADSLGRGKEHIVPSKGRSIRRRFIISSKAHTQASFHAPKAPNGQTNGTNATNPSDHAKAAYARSHEARPPGAPAQAVDLTETIKNLLHLARKHAKVTYDDITDILPD